MCSTILRLPLELPGSPSFKPDGHNDDRRGLAARYSYHGPDPFPKSIGRFGRTRIFCKSDRPSHSSCVNLMMFFSSSNLPSQGVRPGTTLRFSRLLATSSGSRASLMTFTSSKASSKPTSLWWKAHFTRCSPDKKMLDCWLTVGKNRRKGRHENIICLPIREKNF